MEFLYFTEKVDFINKSEIEKVKYTAYFKNKIDNKNSFLLQEVTSLLSAIGHPISNVSRLKTNLSKSKDFKKVGNNGEYILSPGIKQALKLECEPYIENTEEIFSNSEVLDETLFLGYRTYLDRLITQVNACYRNHLYDGCAVMMRRVFEILLIHSFEHHGIKQEIQDGHGNYVMLERIVSKAIESKTLHISRSKNDYNSIREIGNYAAHKIYYNTKKKDIDDIKQTYRACLEELLYKSGLKI
ncbi:DUF4145 domain-containing protein [Paenibacillus sp. 23TSA30-6]|uniref:DUF4145 domain-containing protein n=1 Tax=Paenibacillus sp. 23TSA30-6 TaxID=2546104 RepID=UPI00178856D1|nr:DUF4145 domain-containing protein [Paenibacillus sp. 23TSA30-6]MBE0334950.1 DUF4145 domain-containing protein [Paenibacillus sp. 23TSA30-6]